MNAETFETVMLEKPAEVKELTLGLRSGNEISGACVDPLAYEGYLMLEGKGGSLTAVGVDEIEYLTYKPKGGA
jgi:hypothetical protein